MFARAVVSTILTMSAATGCSLESTHAASVSASHQVSKDALEAASPDCGPTEAMMAPLADGEGADGDRVVRWELQVDTDSLRVEVLEDLGEEKVVQISPSYRLSMLGAPPELGDALPGGAVSGVSAGTDYAFEAIVRVGDLIYDIEPHGETTPEIGFFDLCAWQSPPLCSAGTCLSSKDKCRKTRVFLLIGTNFDACRCSNKVVAPPPIVASVFPDTPIELHVDPNDTILEMDETDNAIQRWVH